MLLINKQEKDRLEAVGLLRHKRIGVNAQDANFQVANRDHKSRAKTYYVTEDLEILTFLQRFDMCNLQRISHEQLDQLVNAGIIKNEEIQHYDEYIPKPLAYIAQDGRVYIPKIAKLLLFLGIWKNNKTKKIVEEM